MKTLVIAVDGMGPSRGIISGAWEVTNMDNLDEIERSKTASDDAREIMDVILGMEFDG